MDAIQIFVILYLILVVNGFVKDGQRNEQTHTELDRTIWNELNNLRGQINQQHDKMSKLERNVDEQKILNVEQTQIIERQAHLITGLNTRIDEQKHAIDAQGDIFQKRHKNDLETITGKQPIPDESYQFTALGCLNEILLLSCPDDRKIFVTSADYGMYTNECTGGCCAPLPTYDCTEGVAEKHPVDWLAVKDNCDNKTQCEYVYIGAVIDDCQSGYTADYMQIFFMCHPDITNEPVGFTAYATASRDYFVGEIVIFDGIRSNFGGHYNPSTSTFQCPCNGVYLFSVNQNTLEGRQMTAAIMLDDQLMVSAWADESTAENSQASAVLVTQCDAGQTVWVYSWGLGMYGHEDGRSHFTGYLLHRY